MAFRPRSEVGRTVTHESHGHVLEARAVPASLRDLLTSRLDEIGEAKAASQFAAALGREFSLEALARLSEREEFELLGDLEQLVTAEILVRQTRVDNSVYMFRHALIRDAAYDSMLPPVRRRAHERIAEGLERHYPVLVDGQPDVLAHHWEHAGDAAQAIRYLQLAAKKSGMASAHLEALAQIDRALALLEQLPASNERTAAEAELQLGRGATLIGQARILRSGRRARLRTRHRDRACARRASHSWRSRRGGGSGTSITRAQTWAARWSLPRSWPPSRRPPATTR